MKIAKLVLHNYLNFKQDLEIDLTYPIDHPTKPGEPLDKVCFLGQSGTGKTALLNLIKYFTSEKEPYDKSCIDLEKLTKGCAEIFYRVTDELFSKVPLDGDSMFDYKKNGLIQKEEYKKHIENLLLDSNPWVLFFPFNVIPPEGEPDRKFVDVNNLLDPSRGTLELKDNKRIWDLNQPDINRFAALVFTAINGYVSEHEKISMECLAKLRTSKDFADLNELDEWEKKNPNPIQKIAEKCLNQFMQHFGLEVETDLRFYYSEQKLVADRFSFVILKQNGHQVPYRFLSTGTKQVILTAIPLLLLEPQNSIILFDQPEASLYPNIQALLPGAYSGLSPSSQFFFASHSPIVASAFEPWEIIELKLNETTNNVEVEKYYDGERSVSNYRIFPQFLSYGDIYTEVFDLAEDGNESFRPAQLGNLAELKQQLSQLKRRGAEDQLLTKKLDEIKDLARKLGVNLKNLLVEEK